MDTNERDPNRPQLDDTHRAPTKTLEMCAPVFSINHESIANVIMQRVRRVRWIVTVSCNIAELSKCQTEKTQTPKKDLSQTKHDCCCYQQHSNGLVDEWEGGLFYLSSHHLSRRSEDNDTGFRTVLSTE